MNKKFGFMLSAITALAVAGGIPAAHADSETQTKKVETGLFDLSYERNSDWRFQCGFELTKKALQMFGAIKKQNRAAVFANIRKVEIVEDSSFFRKKSEAEFDEETGELKLTFVRDEGGSSQKGYCIDGGALRQVVNIVVDLQKEAEEAGSLQMIRDQRQSAEAGEGDSLKKLLESLGSTSQTLQVAPQTRETDHVETSKPAGSADPAPVGLPASPTQTDPGK